MSDSYSTTPTGGGQSPSAPTHLKYIFDPNRCIVFDAEVYPGRWCVGFLFPGREKSLCVDGDRAQLTEILDKIARAGRTLIGYNNDSYDEPILRAVLAGEDPYSISCALIAYDGPGLPPELRDRAARWPRIEADTIDLAVRTKSGGRFPSLKMVAANLNVVNLAELPYDPTKPVTNTQWEEIKQYNEKDLAATKLVLEHFTPELEAISALSARYDIDLRSVHQAGIASQILCAAYRDRYGRDPVKVASPASVQYRPPGPVVRPRNEVAAAWFDRITSESFPLVVPKGGENPKPVVPEPGTPIVVGGIELNVGSGGLHSVDRPALHRSDAGHAIYEADVASYYPSMMAQFGIFPRALGEVGLEQYREILAERLEIKERVLEATEPEEERYFKRQSAGLKIVLNSLFGQLGNPYSVLYDPEAFLAVTLTGQLMLIDLVERLDSAGAILLSVNTDGLTLKVRRDDDRWPKVLDAWESDTGMVLETVPVEALMIEATNHYGVRYADGKTKRRGNLSDAVDWRHVPHHQVVADAVVAALFDGVLPEHSVRRCARPAEFVGVTRRDSSKVGVLVNDATGEETPSPRLVRWYKAKDSQFRIEHRWTDKAGKAHKSTPPGTSGVQLLMDLPEPGHPLGDVDYGWYVGEARARILANRDFNHLDPKWLSGIAADLYARGLAPSPHWAGKKSPRGAKRDRPSYFWEWSRYPTFGTYTGPEVGVLALDIDEPAKFHKWIEAPLWDPRDLGDCLVSYHRCDSPGAVRAGEAKGKLLFQFKADADHPLAKVGKAAFRSTLGIEIFYGHGDPSVLGEHPDGPEAEYLLDGILGSPPDWLIADLVERATKKVRAPKDPGVGGNGKPVDSVAVAKYATAALESEVSQVAAAPEGERNSTLWKASCAIGGLVGAGVVDREEVEEKLVEATTLPPEEAVDVIRRGLDRGMEAPRDLGHVGRNGDGFERPTIEITTEEHSVNDQAIAALANDPDLYQRGYMLVRALREGPRPDDMETGRDPGGLTIVPIHAATLRERFTQYASWVKRKKGEDGETILVPAHPPEWSVPAVLNRGSWAGVRFLEGVTETPMLRADGTVLEDPGWDSRTGVLYLPEIEFPKVPENPTREDAKNAADLLLDLVVDFPFKGPDHKAAWLSALLTPFVRHSLAGPAPLFLFDANTAGSGKTLLCDVLSIVGTGRCVGRTTYPSSEEEMDKCTLAMALNGTKLVLFDNTATGSPIGGAAFDAALTATTRSGRQLGASRFVTDIPFSSTFLCTGNNAGLKGDTLRRVVSSRLESPEDRPEERDGFAIPNLLEHVRENRGALAAAALTVLRAYHVAGRPIPDPKPPPMGGFEAWSNLVRRAVHWVTGHDPLATKGEAKSADKVAVQLPVLIDGWAQLCQSCGDGGLSTAQAIKVLENHPGDHELLRAILTEYTKDGKLPSPNSLGNLLGKVRGRPHAGRSLERIETYGVNQWFVKTRKATTPTPDSQTEGESEPPF